MISRREKPSQRREPLPRIESIFDLQTRIVWRFHTEFENTTSAQGD